MSYCNLCTLWDILFWESDIVMFAEYDLHIWEVISRVSFGGGSASALKTPSHCKLMSQLNPWMDMEGMSMSGTELYSQHLTQETWMFTQMMRQGTFHQYLPHVLPHHCASHTRTSHQDIYLYHSYNTDMSCVEISHSVVLTNLVFYPFVSSKLMTSRLWRVLSGIEKDEPGLYCWYFYTFLIWNQGKWSEARRMTLQKV